MIICSLDFSSHSILSLICLGEKTPTAGATVLGMSYFSLEK